ncbi:hypothetical protein GOEFS_051_00190 [Gordonia effusa NBRC 100432]|uniref:Uncharacterized protein n=1 Tax=Gordonia effusa NBRC 100432 TaxID=1077974 RepID=H0QZS3_9ACTN|nr:hypothetical protein [Gordonia effusa]GAB18324.1 hypothetical protein GOEFS_051_00190 [Gordonia effusa NBRC 100432]
MTSAMMLAVHAASFLTFGTAMIAITALATLSAYVAVSPRPLNAAEPVAQSARRRLLVHTVTIIAPIGALTAVLTPLPTLVSVLLCLTAVVTGVLIGMLSTFIPSKYALSQSLKPTGGTL